VLCGDSDASSLDRSLSAFDNGASRATAVHRAGARGLALCTRTKWLAPLFESGHFSLPRCTSRPGNVLISVVRSYEYGDAMMVKKLSSVGNRPRLIIERPILELLDISRDTPLEVTTDGEALIIRPVKKVALMDRELAAADRLMDAHEETYQKLAK
jgi:antitoxin MazE